MSASDAPLVSVLTPVYNGAAFLAECIESVLAQTYPNFEYIIVNNASTDDTLKIAERYTADTRVRVFSNPQLLDIISNHNRAFSLISPDSQYSKIVSADDWIFPECLERMVACAKANPSAGVVGSYQMSGGGGTWGDWCVKWDQIPFPSTAVPGREIARIHMTGGPHVFGNPTSLIYRSDLVRQYDRFYPNSTAEADTSACCRCMQVSDYGFVHQVLSYERVHNVRTTTRSQNLNAYLSSNISDVQEYGSAFFTPDERRELLDRLMRQYYDFLAVSALIRRNKDFWAYHRKRLADIGYPFSRRRLAAAIGGKIASLAFNPLLTTELVRKQIRKGRDR